MDRDEAVRVSDMERQRVADRLARAQAEGRLELAEFDARVRDAYGAVTRGDLASLTGDLPGEEASVVPAASRRPARRGLAAAVAVWAVVSALNVGIWAIVALAAPGPVHPWWIWVAGPWGAMLVLRAFAERSGVAPAMAVALPSPCGGRRHR